MQVDKRRRASHSSVWIDPAVASFFSGEPGEDNIHYNPPASHTVNASSSSGSVHRTGSAKRFNPDTPIPPHAHPQQAEKVKVRPAYPPARPRPAEDNDVTRIPTVPPPTIWEYESANFEAESSLSALSLVLDAPTHPPKATRRLPAIEEADTIPSSTGRNDDFHHIDEIDTALSRQATSFHSQLTTVHPGEAALPSWTAGGDKQSMYARRLAELRAAKPPALYRNLNNFQLPRTQSLFRHPLDRLRWWLLRPGHIEFVLWLGGTILLMGITLALLFATALSLWTPSGQQSTSTPAGSANTTGHSSTASTTPGVALTLENKGPLLPGQALQLHGQGFGANGTIALSHDQNLPCQPDAVVADEHGSFTASIDDSSWAPGQHTILARDRKSNRTAMLSLTLVAGPSGQNATSTPTSGATTPVPGGNPGSTPTPGNGKPTPGPTPQPTAVVTPPPTPTPTQPPTPTPGTTPTPGVTPTPSVSPSSSSSNTGTQGSNTAIAFGMTGSPLHASPNLGSWLWLLILGYTAAMLMLGIAGVMRKRRKIY